MNIMRLLHACFWIHEWLSNSFTFFTDFGNGYCYRSHNIIKGRCAHFNISSKQISRAECCCTMGAAWGSKCEFCPLESTQEYLQLCPSTGISFDGHGNIASSLYYFLKLPTSNHYIHLVDIDECNTMPDLCINGRCVNTIGSYRCICNKGYKHNPNGTKCVGNLTLYYVWFTCHIDLEPQIDNMADYHIVSNAITALWGS